ncbi:MAG: hypothetical protein O2893_00535 [Cyanobacteria bacterium]|nr:hypothetical protein [Cyanobacteriota bacterium]MDA1169630.1 hypothetical protein [Cyanobacteriota bacterium]
MSQISQINSSNTQVDQLHGQGHVQAWDAVEAYFQCITECSLEDGACVTRCVDDLREGGDVEH